MSRHLLVCASFILGLLLSGAVLAQDTRKKLPREDVVEIPAIGDGLCVSNVFQSNMVLQRGKPVRVWGWADPGENVTVSFAGQSVSAAAGDDRSWTVTFKEMAANATPRIMTVGGKDRSLKLENILVGDVWVLGGQSNMEFPITKVDEGLLEAVSANFPGIRLLTTPRGRGYGSVASFERLHEWSSWSSRHFRKGDWEVCTPETVKDFSAIGYVFGRRLHMAARVPIGLIDTSIGGTTVETWTPADVIGKIEGPETNALLKEWEEKIAAFDPREDLKRRIEGFERQKKNRARQGNPLPTTAKPPTDLRPGPKADRNRPGYCYAGVIRPLEGFAVKGAVFHQGFNNCFGGSAGARMYGQVFGEMIAAWRSAFAEKELPFCIISLCTAGEPQTSENFLKPMYDVGPLIREAQYRTFRKFHDSGDRGIGFVSSFDLRKSWYHPQIKVPAGERAAKWALVTQYGLLKEKEFWLPPSIKDVKRENGTIRLTLSTQIRVKDDSIKGLRGFAIAGKDRRFHPAEIEYYTDGKLDRRKRPVYQRNVLVLKSPYVPEPVHFRYAWARNPMANLVNSRQIPLATQRSDDWILEETPIRLPGSDDKSQHRRIRGMLMKELELTDTERRIRDAEATVEALKEKYAKEKEAWEKRKASELKKARESGKSSG